MSTEIKLLGEPVRTPSGSLLKIEQYMPSGRVEVGVGSLWAVYSHDEIIRLGFGDFSTGILRIGQEAFLEKALIGGNRYLNEELEKQ